MAERSDRPPGESPGEAEEDPSQSNWRDLGLFSVIIGEIIGYAGVGAGLGYLAVKKWGFPGWTIALTTMAGLTLAMVQIYRLTRPK